MRTIAHLSDLHFGRTDAVMIRRVKAQLAELNPDLVVISGDLTQRARLSEFADARAFLDNIPKPQIVVPGNHDIELYNLYGRFVERLQRYRTYISADVEPFYSDPELMVVSVNTARSLTFKGGRINGGQIARVQRELGTAHTGAIKIVVAHHPLDLPASMEHALVGRARAAVRALTDCGVDLILSGHLHVPQLSAPAERLRIGGHTAILVQAGTAISTRSRGEGNSFNVIEAATSRIVIHKRSWVPEQQDFAEVVTVGYERSPSGWLRAPAPLEVR
jgi:3',5'-cyclic AMP phosphodiesterase CpdA